MYFILAVLFLCAAYVALLLVEARRGERLLAPYRLRLDRAIESLQLIATHVDFASFAREEGRRALRYASHMVVRAALEAVRAVERLLTRLIRHLRLHPEAPRPVVGASARQFVRVLSDFKVELETSRPEMSKVR